MVARRMRPDKDSGRAAAGIRQPPGPRTLWHGTRRGPVMSVPSPAPSGGDSLLLEGPLHRGTRGDALEESREGRRSLGEVLLGPAPPGPQGVVSVAVGDAEVVS